MAEPNEIGESGQKEDEPQGIEGRVISDN
jgi:hypothetical protein